MVAENKVGHAFRCVCCGEVHPGDEAHYDEQLDGPVCPPCNINLKWAQARLKQHKIDRPLRVVDLNDQLNKRFGFKKD